MKKTVKKPNFDKDGFITESGQKNLRKILKQFNAPLKALKTFDDGDGIKIELRFIREHYL